MANESLRRTPTSTGNRRVYTLAFWIKRTTYSTYQSVFSAANSNNVNETFLYFIAGFLRFFQSTGDGSGSAVWSVTTPNEIRDSSAMCHAVISIDTTQALSSDRVKIYINGSLLVVSGATYPTINYLSNINTTELHRISGRPSGIQNFEGYLSDFFFVDGQALTPDVFGFYKQGKGYISAGSTQATDFRPGQWVPKSPRVIKTEINRRGGFGVNGFYLPMNDSRNFGADFHGDPNSIITLNEKLPQPRVGVATTASVGLGYTDALRADPYAANLVLALPFVSGGLSSGFGDYAPSIKGSGSAKTITNTNASIASTASYYGSAASFNGTSSILTIPNNSDFYFNGQFTIECWVNWNGTSAYYQNFIGCNKQSLPFNNNAAFFRVWGTSAPDSTIRSRIGIGNPTYDGSGSTFSGVALPTNQLIHVSATRDSSNTTRVFMNGVCVGIKTNDTSIYDFSLEGTAIGQGPWDGAQGYYSGYLQDLRVYKGVAKYTGGFDVPRPYTPVGIATWRAVPDCTANNFATLNPLDKRSTGLSLASGNLYLSSGVLNEWSTIKGNVGVSTGKWYWEISNIYRTGSGSNAFGAVEQSHRVEGDIYIGKPGFGVGYSYGDGVVLTTTDVVGITLDMSNGVLTWYKNGVQVQTQSGISGSWMPAISQAQTNPYCVINFGQNPTFSGNTTAGTFTDSNGKGLFKYQPPSGFLALCEDNLPTPAISNPGQYFKTVLWTGDGNNGRSIVGVGFTPDLVWIKSRSPSAYNHRAFDSVRGAGKDNFLMPNSTAVEGASSDYYGGISSFNNDGFSMVYGTGGSNIGINESGTNFVAWCWRAGAGTTSTNTNGSITSVVSVNQDAGFSIVSYTGTGANATVGHGLGKVPKFIMIKNRTSVDGWINYHSSIGPTGFLQLNTTGATSTSSTVFNDTSPTSNVFSVGTISNTNGSGIRLIAYCWAEIEGFSKFGSYVGNGSADGPFVYCGFKPAFVMIKRTDSTGNWCIHDSSRGPVNVMNEQLQANLSNVESGTGGLIDFLSNGFKIRATSTDLNASNGTYIFAAFAESPFQTANSK